MTDRAARILVIDDNQDNLTVLKALIMEAFPLAVVLSAISGRRGLDIAAKEEPDVILLDIFMPGMDGYEVCRRLKADKQLCDIPVVFITAIKNSKESRVKALECGAEAFLSKPVDDIELTAQIRAMLKIRDASIVKKHENEHLAQLVEESSRDLIRSEAKYRQIAENVLDVVWTADLEMRTTYISPSVEKMLGESPEAYMRKGIEERFTPSSLKTIYKVISEELEIEKDLNSIKNRSRIIELEHYWAVGKVIWVSMHISFLRDENQKAIGFHGVSRDITQRKQMEEQLNQNLRDLLESQRIAHLGTWRLDLATNQVVWSEELYKMYGFDPALPPPPYTEHMKMFTPESWEKLSTAFEITRTSGIPYKLELETKKKDGSNGWMWVRGEAEKDSQGNIITLWGAAQDITEFKKLENERMKFFLLAESSSEFIGMCDLDMNPLYVNPAGRSLVGLPDMAAACQVKVQDYYFPEDQRFIAEEFFPRVLHNGCGDVEIRLRHFQTGEAIWMYYYLFSVLNESGTPIGWATVSHDITKRKETENELHTRRKQIQRILENLQDAYFQVDLLGKVMMVNPSAAHLFGYNSEEMIGMPAENLYADANERSKLLEELKPNGSVQEYMVKRLRKDGSEFWASMNAQYIKNEQDEIVGIEGLLRDVSERIKFAEDLERQRKELEQRLHQSVNAISKIGEIRDVYTSGHQKRVAELACAIGSEMGLPDERINALSIGGLIHDIGKMFIPSDILNKPGKITDLEYEILQTHAEESYNVVKQIDFPAEIPTMIYQHHERLDGTGYPQGSSGDEIILESRILAVADVVEAMNSHRPYRPALGIDAALEEILHYRGTKYDAEVVDVCMKLFKEKGFAFQSS